MSVATQPVYRIVFRIIKKIGLYFVVLISAKSYTFLVIPLYIIYYIIYYILYLAIINFTSDFIF